MVKHLNLFRLVRIFHLIIWGIWALLILTYYDSRSQQCFNALFAKHISYKVFNGFELIFMLGGGWLLLAALQKINKYAAYILFEIVFLGIVAIHLRIYFCK